MTETLVRPYRPADHQACRQLWAELAEEHAARYEIANPGTDPGAAFEEYLTRLDIGGMWVAEDRADGVVGFVGLILDGRIGEIDPVVVGARRRGQGIGRLLLGYVAERARARGVRQLTVSPALRNVEAIHCLHAAGYDALARITLTLELTDRGQSWRDGIDVHDLRFRY
jgi:GNAT superfamily N-acetyltransferase